MNMNSKASLAVFACWGVILFHGLAPAVAADAVRCPAGVASVCSPHRVGTMVLCSSGKVMGYRSVSHFCLSCHAGGRTMGFAHPYEVKYPEDEGFRPRGSLEAGIELNAGFLTCLTCHAGNRADEHFLVGHAGLANVCSHCHLTSIECPATLDDPQSACSPGRVHGKIRCYGDEGFAAFENTSAFCVNCHGGLERMAASHPVEIDYPHHRPGFIEAGSLDPDIRLEDGHITCESCHLKRKHGMAVCVECHPK